MNMALPLLTDIKHEEMSYFMVQLNTQQPCLNVDVTFIL